jgi:hypothetical protein
MINPKGLPPLPALGSCGIVAEGVSLMDKRSKLQLEKLSAPALALAGVLTLCGAVWNELHDLKGDPCPPGSLLLIAMAIVLGVAGLAFANPENSAEARISRGFQYRWVLLVLMALHGLIVVHLIRSPLPRIDTFSLQREATAMLLHGHDPYGTSHANLYTAEETRRFYGPGEVINGRIQIGMPYPPVTFLCLVPGYLIGDIRYGFLAAIFVSAIFIFGLFPDVRGLSLAAVVLLAPVTYLVEYACWTEPLLWMLLCATVYTAVKRPRWLPLALGLFLATKQYNFLALPFVGFLLRPFSWKGYWKLLAQSLGVALATVLPFAIWNFSGEWHDLIRNLFAGAPVRVDALSFAIRFPVYAKIGKLLLLAFAVWAVRRWNQHTGMFAAAYGMALMLFFSSSQLAYLNYYFLITFALWLTAASIWPARQAKLLETERQLTTT